MLAILILALLIPQDDPKPVSIVIAHPGAPGTTEKAKKTMGAFARRIEEAAGLPQGSVRCVFYPEAEPALEFIERDRPKVGIFSLPFFLRYRGELELVPALQVVRQEKTTQTFHVLARRGSHADLDSLKGKRLLSNHIFDLEFLYRVILEGKKERGFFRTEETRKPLRVIRKVARGEEDAVLVDDKQWETLRKMEGIGSELQEIYRSRPVPTEPVVTIGSPPADPRVEKVKAALKGLAESEAGREILADLRMDRFQEPQGKAYEEVGSLYEGESR